MFRVVFPNRSFPIDISTFSQIDNTFIGALIMRMSKKFRKNNRGTRSILRDPNV